MFGSVTNISFEGFCNIEENKETLSVYVLNDIPVDKWNELAKERKQLFEAKAGAVS